MCLSKNSGSQVRTRCRLQQRTTQRVKNRMDREHFSRYRSQVARCLCFGQRRAGITFTADELCQRMSDPMQQSLVRFRKPEGMRVRKTEPCVLGRDFDDWDYTFNGSAGTHDRKAARQSTTALIGDSTARTSVGNAAVPSYDAHTKKEDGRS